MRDGWPVKDSQHGYEVIDEERLAGALLRVRIAGRVHEFSVSLFEVKGERVEDLPTMAREMAVEQVEAEIIPLHRAPRLRDDGGIQDG